MALQEYHYDLHMHSCLSPCADNDMTPNNLVNMALLGGLDVIAVTDTTLVRQLRCGHAGWGSRTG